MRKGGRSARRLSPADAGKTHPCVLGRADDGVRSLHMAANKFEGAEDPIQASINPAAILMTDEVGMHRFVAKQLSGLETMNRPAIQDP